MRKTKPLSLQNQKKWLCNRRAFFKTMIAGAIASQIPWWVACTRDTTQETSYLFNSQQEEILYLVQDFLFPSDGNGPGASDINAVAYLQWVLLDPEMDPEEKNYILDGLAWVEETAVEEKDKSFLKLSAEIQEEILKYISGEEWGEAWFSVLLNFIFEALLSDPVYASNPDGIGWKWLHHNPGYPRPDEDQKYGQFLYHINAKTPQL